MEFEFKRVDDFVKLEIQLQNGDYMYEHSTDIYPLRKEVDLENLYFVTNNSNGIVQLHSMARNKEISINLIDLDNNWWVMKLPEFVRKKIGLQ